MSLPGDRLQEVIVEASEEPGQDPILSVFSVCAPADPAYYQYALRLNSQLTYGSISVHDVLGSPMFVMSQSFLRDTVRPEDLRNAIIEIARRSDRIEKKLTMMDQYQRIPGSRAMAKPDSLAWSSVALASAIALCAVLLGLRLWWERRTREEDLAAPDQKHFMLQDLRRAIGIGLMALLALGVYYGSRLPTVEIEPMNPGAGGSLDSAAGDVILPALEVHPDRRFLAVWLAVFVGIVLLLVLAMIDWFSTRRYARRHRDAMSQARLDILRETLSRHESDRNGSAEAPKPEPSG